MEVQISVWCTGQELDFCWASPSSQFLRTTTESSIRSQRMQLVPDSVWQNNWGADSNHSYREENMFTLTKLLQKETLQVVQIHTHAHSLSLSQVVKLSMHETLFWLPGHRRKVKLVFISIETETYFVADSYLVKCLYRSRLEYRDLCMKPKLWGYRLHCSWTDQGYQCTQNKKK